MQEVQVVVKFSHVRQLLLHGSQLLIVGLGMVVPAGQLVTQAVPDKNVPVTQLKQEN